MLNDYFSFHMDTHYSVNNHYPRDRVRKLGMEFVFYPIWGKKINRFGSFLAWTIIVTFFNDLTPRYLVNNDYFGYGEGLLLHLGSENQPICIIFDKNHERKMLNDFSHGYSVNNHYPRVRMLGMESVFYPIWGKINNSFNIN